MVEEICLHYQVEQRSFMSESKIITKCASCFLIRPVVSTLSKSKVGKNLDGFFLFFDRCLDQILNGDHAHQFAVVDQRQVTNIGGKHLFHTGLNGISRLMI